MRFTSFLAALLVTTHAHAATTEEHRGLVLAGQVMRNDGKLLRARELLTSCRDAACDDAATECEEIRRYCTAKLAETVAAIPSIDMDVRDDRGLPVHAMLRVDAALAENQSALDLDPGHHVVRATYAGVTGSAEVTLESGQKHVRVPIVLDLRRTVQSRPVPTGVFILETLAGVATASASGFGIGVQAQVDSFSSCKPTCDPSRSSLFTATTITVDASIVVAAISGLAGLIWYLARPTRSHVVHIEEHVGP